MRRLGHALLVLLLTVVTQLGGLAWLIALATRWRLASFAVAYVLLSGLAVIAAPQFGRVALPCSGDKALQVQSPLYCALNRHYVTPELHRVLSDLATAMDARQPGTQTLVLDANFPFLDGFPLLPHLSHDDGRKVDIAFAYRDATGYLRGATRSPLGYFAFEQGPTDCRKVWPTLRWDLDWLQPYWRDLMLEEDRTAAALDWLSGDARVTRVFVEPHLKHRLNAAGDKIRFQGCRAARHDDHIHIEI